MAQVYPTGRGKYWLNDVSFYEKTQDEVVEAWADHADCKAVRQMPPARQVVHHARTSASILRQSYPGKYQIVEPMDDAHVSIFRVPR